MQHDIATAVTDTALPAVHVPLRLHLPTKPVTPPASLRAPELAPDPPPLWIIARAPESIDEHRCWTIYDLDEAPGDVFETWFTDAVRMHNLTTMQRRALHIIHGETYTGHEEPIEFPTLMANVDHTWPRAEKWRCLGVCTAYGLDWAKYWYLSRADAIEALIARQRGITAHVAELARGTQGSEVRRG